MIANERLREEDFIRADVSTQLRIPFFQSYVKAGFPSPADNYIERVCDLNDLCITNAEATYFVRVASDSMIGDRIDQGDLLIVDCSREPLPGRIVVVWHNGGHIVKRIQYVGDIMAVLLSSNEKYEPIYVQADDEFRIFGVVTFVIQKPV